MCPALKLVTASVLGLVVFVPPISATAKKPKDPPAPVSCAAVTGGCWGRRVSSRRSTIVPAAGTNVSYCQVNVLYGTSPNRTSTCVWGCRSVPLDGGTRRRGGRVERPHTRHRRRRLLGQPGRERTGECRLRGLGQRHRAHRRQLRARREHRRHLQPAVHQRFHPQRHEAAGAAVKHIAAHVLRQASRPTTTGTAAPPAAARATCWRRNSAANSTASWPTHRRSIGRAFKRRRCGARS